MVQPACKEEAPVGSGVPTFVHGLWKSDIPMDTTWYDYGSPHYLEYIEFESEFHGRLYFQTQDLFRWSLPATYTVDGVTIRVATDVWREFAYDPGEDRILYGTRPYSGSADTAVARAWADSVPLAHQFLIPGPGRRANRYQGLAFDGTSFYTLDGNTIRNFSMTGGLIRVVPIPPADSLTGGSQPYPTSIAWADGFLWLSVWHYPETQRIYRLRPDSLTPDGSVFLHQTSRRIHSIAVSDSGTTIWAIAQHFIGAGYYFLHTIDAQTGNETAESLQLEVDPSPLAYHEGFLWGERIVNNSDVAQRHYLQEFNPADRLTRRSVRVRGFENVIPVPYSPEITGVVVAGTDLYVLDGYDHTLWKGILVP